MGDEVKYRFWVGFFSSLAIPLAKVYQNGIAVEQLNGMILLGASVPILAMAALVGLYAHFLEKGCQDVKQLFKICVSLPGLLVTLGGGISNEAQAQADETYQVANAEYTCVPVSDFYRGIAAVLEALTGKKHNRYWVLSKTEATDTYVIVDKRKYFVTAKLPIDPGGLVYDQFDCKIIDRP